MYNVYGEIIYQECTRTAYARLIYIYSELTTISQVLEYLSGRSPCSPYPHPWSLIGHPRIAGLEEVEDGKAKYESSKFSVGTSLVVYTAKLLSVCRIIGLPVGFYSLTFDSIRYCSCCK